LPESIEQLERAIESYKNVGDRRGECLCAHNLANKYLGLGEDAKARRLAGDALQIAHTIGYRLIECAATDLLATLMVHETRFDDAIREYEKACALADDSNAVQVQAGVRLDLAWASLLAGDLARARTVVEEATKYKYPGNYGSVLALKGVVALRQGDTTTASKAFEMTRREADAQPAGRARDYYSTYAKALALAGLTLCRDPALARAAADAYRDARAVSAAPGLVMDELQKLDALAAADPTGILREVRAALNVPRREGG
jgi:tetratricopeptide (TPR) repeat protein